MNCLATDVPIHVFALFQFSGLFGENDYFTGMKTLNFRLQILENTSLFVHNIRSEFRMTKNFTRLKARLRPNVFGIKPSSGKM